LNKLLSKQSFEGPVIDLSTADVVAQALPTFDTEKTNISDRDSKSPILTIDECCIETAGDEFAQRDGAVNTTFKNTTNKTSLKTVFLISGTTHFIFLAALIHFTDFGTVLKQTAMEPEIIPIQATLYFPPQVIQAPEAIEKPPEIEAQAPLQEPIQEISEAIAEQEIIPEITEEIATIEPATSEVQEIDATVSEVTDTELAVDETLPEMPTEEGSATLQSDTNRSTRMEQLNRSMLSHLNNMQQAQIEEMSLDASRNRELDFTSDKLRDLNQLQKYNKTIL
jgi:hypothetical protein